MRGEGRGRRASCPKGSLTESSPTIPRSRQPPPASRRHHRRGAAARCSPCPQHFGCCPWHCASNAKRPHVSWSFDRSRPHHARDPLAPQPTAAARCTPTASLGNFRSTDRESHSTDPGEARRERAQDAGNVIAGAVFVGDARCKTTRKRSSDRRRSHLRRDSHLAHRHQQRTSQGERLRLRLRQWRVRWRHRVSACRRNTLPQRLDAPLTIERPQTRGEPLEI